MEFHLDISCLYWKLLTDGQGSVKGDVGSQYWVAPKAMFSNSVFNYLCTYSKSLYRLFQTYLNHPTHCGVPRDHN